MYAHVHAYSHIATCVTYYQLSIQLQGSTPDSEGSHSNDTEEHWTVTGSTLHCEAVHIIMTCERCSRTVDCQLCPVCQGPIHTVYIYICACMCMPLLHTCPLGMFLLASVNGVNEIYYYK